MLIHKLRDKHLVLASKSPRRQQLLRELELSFEVRLNGETDECYPAGLSITEIPMFLARKKAEPLMGTLQSNEILITSDTIVWCKNEVIGKPLDRDDAIKTLNKLSGDKHVVITGVCLSTTIRSTCFHVETDVYFRKLTQEEICYYVDRYKPYDKAGAYGVQEWIGYVGVERIEGSYFNVMGLPVQRLYTELEKFIDQIT